MNDQRFFSAVRPCAPFSRLGRACLEGGGRTRKKKISVNDNRNPADEAAEPKCCRSSRTWFAQPRTLPLRRVQVGRITCIFCSLLARSAASKTTSPVPQIAPD